MDLSAASIEKAKTRLAEAYVADVTHPERYPKFGRSMFDIIVFSDILEHLGDPLDSDRRVIFRSWLRAATC